MNNSIYVNMTPNPLDLQQLSCSQGDTSSRKFQLTLHNQGEVYDLSNISDPVFTSFPVSAGGTEELLPTSTSTPATSPIVADIRYPDGLRQEESFTYRESPTTVSGNAKLKALYGNSIVWNQLERNDGTTVTSSGTTYTNNGDGTWTLTGTPTGYSQKIVSNTHVNGVVGHKYLFMGCPDTNQTNYAYRPYINGASQGSRDYGKGIVLTCTTESAVYGLIVVSNATSSLNVKFTPMIIDLTVLGMDDVTDKESFQRYFSLPYYDYNQGTLIPFSGNGIKTTGKNQVLKVIEVCNIDSTGKLFADSQNYYDMAVAYVIKGQQYTFQPSHLNEIMGYFLTEPSIGSQTYDKNRITNGTSTFTAQITGYVAIRLVRPQTNAQLEFGSTATDYEPYTESTTSLPTLTYFPTGMKSAGSVRDELTDNKATTRVGTLVLNGSEAWTRTAANNYYIQVNYIARASDYRETMSSDKATVIVNAGDSTTDNSPIWVAGYPQNSSYRGQNWLYMHNDSVNTLNDFKAWLQANPVTINYELATSSEESIMSATLVTENGEAPLYHNGDVLECECNSDISKEAGFFDAKIGFTDNDGTNYSNKIQLHVERSPQ